MNSGGLGAVVFAVLLIVSMVAPAVSAQTNANGTSGQASYTAPQVAQQSFVNTSDDPAIVLKARAIEQVRSLEDSDALNDTLVSTLYHYRGPTRVNSSDVFRSDSQALRTLQRYVSGGDIVENATRASVLVTAADNRTAYRTVQDAEQALAVARERIDHRGTLRSSQAHLDNARRAYQRGLSELDRAQAADPSRAIHHRAQAVGHFRQAWKQSRLVLDRLDGSISPEVTIVNRADPVRNGSANRTVSATVRAIDPEGIDTATVFVDGQQRKTVNVSTAGVAPFGNATFSATVHLPNRTANVTVVAEETDTTSSEGEDRDSRGGGPPAHAGSGGNGNGNGPPSHAGPPGRDNPGEDPSGEGSSATLLLDGDGLMDTYEQDVLGTDPLDPDSDASVTNADESDNSVLDGAEDFDGDGLATLRELDLGTDPLAADTDGDGIDDRFEHQLTETDPLDSDSDGDGVDDGAEDLDGDGLTNAQEAEAGTVPQLADADQDGLTDSQELDNDTDPFASDTDSDGLDDRVEIKSPYNTDPTDPDTDSDNVLDGNETYTVSTANESLGVSVDVTGQGAAVATTTIEQPTHARFAEESPLARNVSVAEGPFADFETEGEIDSATLTFEYNESQISTNESALAVYRFNETLQRYEKLPSTVEPDADTISTNTSHFSTYTVLDEGAYQAFLTRMREAVVTSDTQVVFQEDFEGLSMNNSAWTCRNDPYGGSHGSTPAKGFCEIEDGWATVQEETNRMRYLNRTVTLDVPEDSDVLVTTHVKAHINAQWTGAAMKLVVENGSESRTVAALDNKGSAESRTIDTVTTADVSDFAGETVNISLQADGRWTYQYQETASWISVNNITITGGQLEDGDGDGIPDLQEQHLPLRNYGVVSTSTDSVPLGVPRNSFDYPGYDTDSDGLPDGVEVINTTKVIAPNATLQRVYSLDQQALDQGDYNWLEPSTYINESALMKTSDGFYGYPWLADPTERDTDGDGLDDYTEQESEDWNISVVTKSVSGEEVPYRPAFGDEVGDKTLHFSSDPKQADSDEDGVDDGEEWQLETDPTAEQTYHLTTEHEWLLGSINPSTAHGQRVLSSLQPTVSVDEPTLTDATDDFDLVLNQTGAGTYDWFYTPLGARSDTTDRWLSNGQEFARSSADRRRDYEQYQTDPWDPDTDDDGLTDGQEIYGIEANGDTYRTDPTRVDTDGDLYWDGWIGVYGVGHSDNVILYKEHLRSGDGIEGDEIVQEQIGVHHTSRVASAGGADIDNDGLREHSNIHIGELQWKTDPAETDDMPTVGISVEVDFLEGTTSLDSQDWENGIEENWDLYGISLGIDRDDTITTGPFASITNHGKFNSENRDLFMLIGDEPIGGLTGPGVPDKIENAWAFNFDRSSEDFGTPLPANGMILFHHRIRSIAPSRVSERDLDQSPYYWQVRVLASKIAMHEIGHSLRIGEADDNGRLPLGEVYSGSAADETPELVNIRGDSRAIWSIMRRGWTSPSLIYHKNTGYYTFSLEELSTISDIDD